MTPNEEFKLRVTKRRGAPIIEVPRHDSLTIGPLESARVRLSEAKPLAPAPTVFKFIFVAPAPMAQHALEEMTFSA